MTNHLFKKSLLCIALAGTFESAFADHLLECPSAEAVRQFACQITLPYQYKPAHKTVQFVTVAMEEAPKMSQSRYRLVMYPIPVGLNEDPEVMTHQYMQQLVLETKIPLNYNVTSQETVPVCIYTVPGNNDLTVSLFSNDQEDDGHSNQPMAKKFLNFVKIS